MVLNSKQIDLLFEATEHHLKWYKTYYPQVPEFDVLLELNHVKIKQFYVNKENCTSYDITNKLLDLIQEYVEQLSSTSNINKRKLR